jgi:hypothetical protein
MTILRARYDGLPFEAQQFDLLICALMLSHVPNLAQGGTKGMSLTNFATVLLLVISFLTCSRERW